MCIAILTMLGRGRGKGLVRILLLTFSPFAAVSLFGVAGLAETFPSFSVSGPFLLDFPGFQVPSDSYISIATLVFLYFPSILISATAWMFSVSPLLLTCPNHSSLLRLITVAIASTFASSNISSFQRKNSQCYK